MVDDVTYELELTRRSGEWMVKLVTPNKEALRSRKLESRWAAGGLGLAGPGGWHAALLPGCVCRHGLLAACSLGRLCL